MNLFFLFQFAYSSQFSDRIVENILTKLLSMVDKDEVTLCLKEEIDKVFPFWIERLRLCFDEDLNHYIQPTSKLHTDLRLIGLDSGIGCSYLITWFILKDSTDFTFEPAIFNKIYKFLTRKKINPVILYNLKETKQSLRREYEESHKIDHKLFRTNFVSRLNRVSKSLNGPKFIYLGDIQNDASYFEATSGINIEDDFLFNKSCNLPKKCVIKLTVDDYIHYLFSIDLSDLDYPEIYQEHLKEILYETYENILKKNYKDDFQVISKFLAHFDVEKMTLRYIKNNFEGGISRNYFKVSEANMYDDSLETIKNEQGKDRGYEKMIVPNQTGPDTFKIQPTEKLQKYMDIIKKLKSIDKEQLEGILLTMQSLSDYDLLVQVMHQLLNQKQRAEKVLFMKLIYQRNSTLDQNEKDWLANYKEPELTAENSKKFLEIIFKILEIDNPLENPTDNINLIIFLYFEIQDYFERCKKENVSCAMLNDFKNLKHAQTIKQDLNSNVFLKAFNIIKRPLYFYRLEEDQQYEVVKYIMKKCNIILSNNGLEKANERRELKSRHETAMVEELEKIEKLFFKLDELNEKSKANLALDFQDVREDNSN